MPEMWFSTREQIYVPHEMCPGDLVWIDKENHYTTAFPSLEEAQLDDFDDGVEVAGQVGFVVAIVIKLDDWPEDNPRTNKYGLIAFPNIIAWCFMTADIHLWRAHDPAW